MTQEEIIEMATTAFEICNHIPNLKIPKEFIEIFAKLVAAKAIAELESQEPVAYLCENAVGHKYFRWKKPTSIYKPIALYIHPPQRTWQGLTEEDKKQMFKEANYHWEMTAGEYAERIGQLTEAKLKERNT
jgi:hypothetical protein